jgi:ATP adenylyltransferase
MIKRNNLWAPWRMQYIHEMEKEIGKKKKSCFLCDKIKMKDEKALIVKRGKDSFALLNIYPYNNGHLLFAPYQHVADFEGLSDSHLLEIFRFISEFKAMMIKKMKCDGFNLGVNIGKAAGAGLEEHIHFHLVPRWTGDTNFMPIISDIKVIPQSLSDLWRYLVKG